MEDYSGNDVKTGKPKWLMWAIIGIAVAVVIGIVVMVSSKDPSSASGLMLDEVNAKVDSVYASLQPVLTWKATSTQDIADLKSKDTSLQTQISGITTPKDWTVDFNALMADMSDLQDDWAGVNETIQDAVAGINITLPRYAMVSLMTKYQGTKMQWYGDIFTNIEVYGQGNYPIIVTFYGSDLDNSSVYWPVGASYDVQTSLVFNYNCTGNVTQVVVNNTTLDLPNYQCVPEAVELVAFVVPNDSWSARDGIQLGIDPGFGSIDYASATVGGTWLLPAVPTPGDWPI